MVDRLQKFIKSLNPKKQEQAILFYGSSYRLFRKGRYLGVATWTKDENVGDSFQQSVVDKLGNILVEVYVPDRWELIPKKN